MRGCGHAQMTLPRRPSPLSLNARMPSPAALTLIFMATVALGGLGLTNATAAASMSPDKGAVEGETKAGTADTCRLSPADKARNRDLPWSEFEFSTSLAKAPMGLSGKACYAAAVEASEDYLATGPALSVREKSITLLHMARNLAMAGDEAGAARLAAAARRGDQAANAPLDWNSYVSGFHAFLSKDRARLDEARGNLQRKGGEGNSVNADNLARLQTCFERSYAEAMTATSCGVGTGH